MDDEPIPVACTAFVPLVGQLEHSWRKFMFCTRTATNCGGTVMSISAFPLVDRYLPVRPGWCPRRRVLSAPPLWRTGCHSSVGGRVQHRSRSILVGDGCW